MYNFRPLTEAELDEYAGKEGINRDIIEEMRKIGVLLPRIVGQYQTHTSVVKRMYSKIATFIRKVDARLILARYLSVIKVNYI